MLETWNLAFRYFIWLSKTLSTIFLNFWFFFEFWPFLSEFWPFLDENGQNSKKNKKIKKMADKSLDNYMKHIHAKFHVSSTFGRLWKNSSVFLSKSHFCVFGHFLTKIGQNLKILTLDGFKFDKYCKSHWSSTFCEVSCTECK